LLAIVGIVVMAKGGYHHHALSAGPFKLHGLAIGVLGLGVVKAFSAFSGFEGAATLGEESRDATRIIPRAIAWSLVGSAGIYIVFTWIANNAYPSAAALAAAPAPFVHHATVNVGTVTGKAVNIAGVISAFGAQRACTTGANRLLFALGRDSGAGGGPSQDFLTRTHPRFDSPVGALMVTGSASLATVSAFSFEATAAWALTLILQCGAYLIIVAYLLTVIAAVAWVLRTSRRPVPLAVLGVGVVVLGYVLYDTFKSFPPAPFNWVVLAAGAGVLGGLGFVLIPPVRARQAHSPVLRATRRESRAVV
jgi:amino acid transporter